jgi:hypothetical protein
MFAFRENAEVGGFIVCAARVADLSRRGVFVDRILKGARIALLIRSPNELRVHGDRDLLIEAVDNAAKFTPEIDRILRETITDPVGPEFKGPPSLSSEA